jgi:hypothetical protein
LTLFRSGSSSVSEPRTGRRRKAWGASPRFGRLSARCSWGSRPGLHAGAPGGPVILCSIVIPGALPRAISGRPFRAQEGSFRSPNGAVCIARGNAPGTSRGALGCWISSPERAS